MTNTRAITPVCRDVKFIVIKYFMIVIYLVQYLWTAGDLIFNTKKTISRAITQ